MSSNDNENIVMRRSRPTLMGIVNLITAGVIMCVFSSSSASAQCTYSDSWLSGRAYAGDSIDYGEDNSAAVSITAAGVTDGDYTHYYYVNTTLQSPNGRSEFTSGGEPGSVGYASTSLALQWDQDDNGDYTTTSDHYSYCPYGAGGVNNEVNYFFAGSTFSKLSVGVSFTCFEYVRVLRIFVGRDGVTKRTALYRITNPCNASCKANTATYTFPEPVPPSPALLSAEPYVGTPPFNVCGHIATLAPGVGCNGCSDVTLP
jgi:hypothetical protein